MIKMNIAIRIKNNNFQKHRNFKYDKIDKFLITGAFAPVEGLFYN